MDKILQNKINGWALNWLKKNHSYHWEYSKTANYDIVIEHQDEHHYSEYTVDYGYSRITLKNDVGNNWIITDISDGSEYSLHDLLMEIFSYI